MLSYTLKDIENFVNSGTFQRGERYFDQGKVSLVTKDLHADLVQALVKGSAKKTYQVTLQQDEVGLLGYCSCPVGQDCKHAVATAFLWLEKQQEQIYSQSGKSSIIQQSSWDTWLKQFPSPALTQTVSGPLNTKRYYLLYNLQLMRDGKLVLNQQKAYLKKNGDWSQFSHFDGQYSGYGDEIPGYMLPQDLHILRLLKGADQHYSGLVLRGVHGGLILQALLQTKRLRNYHNGAWIKATDEMTLGWKWQVEKNHHQLHAQLADGRNCRLIDTSPLYYMDEQSNEMGPILSELPPEQAIHLSSFPPVPTSELSRVAMRLQLLVGRESLPLPETTEAIMEVSSATPMLTLAASKNVSGTPIPGVILSFDYSGCRMPFNTDSASESASVITQKGKSWLVRRDKALERSALMQLLENRFQMYEMLSSDEWIWKLKCEDPSGYIQQWKGFVDKIIPTLQQQGWLIEVDPSYSYQIEHRAFDIHVIDSSNHWFEFALQLPLAEYPLNIRDVISDWLEQGMPDELMVVTPEGWLQIDTAKLKPLHGLIVELYEKNLLDEPVKLQPFQVAQLINQDLNFRDAPLTLRLLEQLQNFKGIEPVPTPQGLNAVLRDYQLQGLAWLDFLQHYRLGGILADDMGLGKTLQTLALVQRLKEQRVLECPVLVVAPTSLMGNWVHEAREFTPELRVCLLHGPDRALHYEQISHNDLIVTSYPLLLRDFDQYQHLSFSLLILDEAQAIKNPKTKLASVVRHINSEQRLCLTGTPLENHLGELWALMDFVLPGLLGGQVGFNKLYRKAIEQEADVERQQALAQRVAPFMLRRTKNEVVAELPPKSEMVQYVELDGDQRELYEAIRVSMQKRVRDLIATKGLARSRIEFLDALLKLRQVCIDPRLVKLEKAKSISQSAKLDWLAGNLPEMVEEGRQILIFSQFTQALSLVESLLIEQGISYTKLTGQTKKRQQAIEQFQSGKVRVFLISLKAGGSGLNLTAADTVIHIDPWWNPAVEQQATDRAYRIGQDKPVFVYKLVAANTVEERIQQMQQQKQALADALFEATGTAGMPVDSDQLLKLFSED